VGGGSGPPAGRSAIGPGLAPARHTTTTILYQDSIDHHVPMVIPFSSSMLCNCTVNREIVRVGTPRGTVRCMSSRYSTSRNRCNNSTLRLTFLPIDLTHTSLYLKFSWSLRMYSFLRRLHNNVSHVFTCKFNISDTSMPCLRCSFPRKALFHNQS
jgi:hypothetical protein